MEKIGHDADITLWINYGSGPDDKTTLEQRKEAGNLAFGKYIQDNYYELKKVAMKNGRKLSFDSIRTIMLND